MGAFNHLEASTDASGPSYSTATNNYITVAKDVRNLSLPSELLSQLPFDPPESLVNGVWSHILAQYFPFPDFIIAPEHYLEDEGGKKRRVDLIVVRVVDQTLSLVFERKSRSRSAKEVKGRLDQQTQLDNSMHASEISNVHGPITSMDLPVSQDRCGIGASDTKFFMICLAKVTQEAENSSGSPVRIYADLMAQCRPSIANLNALAEIDSPLKRIAGEENPRDR